RLSFACRVRTDVVRPTPDRAPPGARPARRQHEEGHPPRVPAGGLPRQGGRLRLPDPLDRHLRPAHHLGGRPQLPGHRRGGLQRQPPLLHREGARGGHRRARRAVPAPLRRLNRRKKGGGHRGNTPPPALPRAGPGRGQIAFHRCSRWKAPHPGSTGNQNVSTRNSSTAGRPTVTGTPATVVRPVSSAASTAPSPPGVGAADPTALPARNTTATAAIPASPPNADTEKYRVSTKPRVSSSVPPTPMASRCGRCSRSSS